MPKPGIYKNSKGQYAYWDGNAWGDGGRTFATREEAESFHSASVRWGSPSSSQEPGRGTEFGNMPNTVGTPRVFAPPQGHSVKWGAPGFTPPTGKPQFAPPARTSSPVPQSQPAPKGETDLGEQSELEDGLQQVSEPESKSEKTAKNPKKGKKKKSKTAIVVVSVVLLGILAAAGYGIANHKTAIVVQGSGMFKEYSNDKSEKERLSDTTKTEGGNASGLTYEQLTAKAEEAKKQGNEGQYEYYTQLAEAAKKDANKDNPGSSASPSSDASSDTKDVTDIGGMGVSAKKANNNDTKALADAKDIAAMLSRGECKAAKEKYLPDEGNDGYVFPCDGWDVVKDAKVEVISDDVSMSTGREVVQVRWGKDKDKTQQAQLLFSSDSKLEQVIPMKNS